ncbi:rhodanese-like domain-containing protein [Bosea sp. (in: a-proteobacteria)]|uniref:rhodanese-like domain-containing protein n=1 Tax=Bosea sp. (in: a-proteobacteria) TaxID=1871050 RepID=UPI0026379627|nr:rhodanese-like domain-containing protein [Bosea sp. (in: a-proteobacteria)]MCO5092112.1 rhodanese-like domain-containing protein [Bosea sp. (in: a-proteobacteria)]
MIVNDLDIDDVRAGLEDGSILLVDVREPHEFAAGHIPGAVSRPLSRFDPADLPNEPGKRIVLSCAAGVRSRRALAFAQSAGLDIDSHYAGGFRDWLMRGGPVTRG